MSSAARKTKEGRGEKCGEMLKHSRHKNGCFYTVKARANEPRKIMILLNFKLNVSGCFRVLSYNILVV